MKQPICLVFLMLYGGVLAKPSYYIDVVLHNFLPQEAKNFNVDPAHLSNFTTQSEDKITFVNVKVKMNYYDGRLRGLLKVRRAGDCPPVHSEHGNTTLNCTILFSDINFNYQAKMKYGQLPTTNVRAHAKMSPTYALVEVTTKSHHNSPYLRQLKLTKTGSVEAKFTGLGPLNSQLKKLTAKSFIGHVNSEFYAIFHNGFVPAMKRAVTRILMPL